MAKGGPSYQPRAARSDWHGAIGAVAGGPTLAGSVAGDAAGRRLRSFCSWSRC